jgi:hypothetical protein
VEHVEVDVRQRPNQLPFRHIEADVVGDLASDGVDLPKLHGVGVARVQNDLDDVDRFGVLDVKLQAVLEVDESMGAQHAETDIPELLNDGLSYHAGLLAKSPLVAAFFSTVEVWV